MISSTSSQSAPSVGETLLRVGTTTHADDTNYKLLHDRNSRNDIRSRLLAKHMLKVGSHCRTKLAGIVCLSTDLRICGSTNQSQQQRQRRTVTSLSTEVRRKQAIEFISPHLDLLNQQQQHKMTSISAEADSVRLKLSSVGVAVTIRPI